MNNKRPVNLDLGSLKFPPMAIASILHRISGIVLFLLLPFMMYFLSVSLPSQVSFEHLQDLLAKPSNRVLMWAFSTALIYHVLAGFRHMIMDLGFGETLVVARYTAIIVIACSVILTIGLGVWLC